MDDAPYLLQPSGGFQLGRRAIPVASNDPRAHQPSDSERNGVQQVEVAFGSDANPTEQVG